MDGDRDLDLLRAWRRDEAEPPADLRPRIEERLWQAILDEERGRSPRTVRARRWFEGLLRPAVAAGAASTIAIVVALASDGGSTAPTTGTGTSIRAAGVLDATATTLFGEQATSRAPSAPIAGVIDLSSAADDHDEALARGPVVDESGVLDERSREFVADASREPAVLQDRLRSVAAAATGEADPTDRVAFNMAMRWVVHPAAPGDLRAAMLRSLDGMAGIDAAIAGVDLLGRRGVVVGHLDGRTGLREQYVLRPEGGQLLERRAFIVGYLDPACPPGTFTDLDLYSDDGRLVTPADAPWLDWPPVVDSCDRASRDAD